MSEEVLKSIWRKFWEDPETPAFPGDYEGFIKCRDIFVEIAEDKLMIEGDQHVKS